jgi:hypothetical protein
MGSDKLSVSFHASSRYILEFLFVRVLAEERPRSEVAKRLGVPEGASAPESCPANRRNRNQRGTR